MTDLWKIIVKDLIIYGNSKGMLFWLFLFPILLLMLTGDIGLKDSPLNLILISGDDAYPAPEKIEDYVTELSNVNIVGNKIECNDIRHCLMANQADGALVWDRQKEKWSVYTLDRSGSQLLSMIAQSFSQEIFSFSSVVLNQEVDNPPNLYVFSPARFGKDLFNVPIFITLVICLYPFVFASSSYIREREGGTLEILLASPGGSWQHIYWGKIILSIILTVVSVSLLLIFSQYWFNFGMKTGFMEIMLVQVLTMLSSAFLGFGLSTFLRNSQDGYLMSAIYLLCLILLTGIIFPIHPDSFLINAISKFFPATFSAEMFENWLSYGIELQYYSKDIIPILFQCGAYFMFSLVGVHLEKKRF
ncbi:ABC transporter permease [Desulfospira joergensenii]|uniref:ABC transporter permease n=1 Tax=Desulfospira joergensenii TaxID=53329 RepID=UPI0003B4ABAA|nr:ABC transporter permease [Desulfospira joergensenii]